MGGVKQLRTGWPGRLGRDQFWPAAGLSQAEDALGSDEMPGPVSLGQSAGLDPPLAAGGVDEAAAADIDAHVGDPPLQLGRGEEDQIAGLELAPVHRPAGLVLSAGGAVEFDAVLSEDPVDQTRAIEAVARGFAAPPVGRAQKRLGGDDDGLGIDGVAEGRLAETVAEGEYGQDEQDGSQD